MRPAEVDLRRGYAIRKKTLPDDNTLLATSRIDLGLLLVDLGRFTEAESLLTRGVAVREAANGPTDRLAGEGRAALEKMRGGGKRG